MDTPHVLSMTLDDLLSLPMHNLMHALVRNTELPRKLNLRDSSSISSTNNDIAFTSGESWIRRRGL